MINFQLPPHPNMPHGNYGGTGYQQGYQGHPNEIPNLHYQQQQAVAQQQHEQYVQQQQQYQQYQVNKLPNVCAVQRDMCFLHSIHLPLLHLNQSI